MQNRAITSTDMQNRINPDGQPLLQTSSLPYHFIQAYRCRGGNIKAFGPPAYGDSEGKICDLSKVTADTVRLIAKGNCNIAAEVGCEYGLSRISNSYCKLNLLFV